MQQKLLNIEIGTQFPDSENVQRILKITQNPRLHGTYVRIYCNKVNMLSFSAAQ